MGELWYNGFVEDLPVAEIRKEHEMKKPFVFISYSTKEADAANLVHSYLEGNGIACWIASQNIEGGESFAAKIVDAIEECAAFVMIASSHSNASPHVGNELSLAMHYKKKVIPLKIREFELSRSNFYFLQQAQWIDARGDMNAALRHLLEAVRAALPAEEETEREPMPVIAQPEDEADVAGEELPVLSREEIADRVVEVMTKFPYCLWDRAKGEAFEAFGRKAQSLFEKILTMYFKGRPTAGGLHYVDLVVDTLGRGAGVSIQVVGLPGCAKNMLVQLAFYKMLEEFRAGRSDHLPLYLSAGYYEKLHYGEDDPRGEMKQAIRDDCKEYFAFLRRNPTVRPVLMLEAVRQHVVSRFAPEDVILELWAGQGKFNRIVTRDTGLVQNRLRHKRTMPILGNTAGYTMQFSPIPTTEKDKCLAIIRLVLEMYADRYDGLEAEDVYRAIHRLRYAMVDVFTVRLIATELSLGHSAEDISLYEMYERQALTEVKGDEEALYGMGRELYEYALNDRYNVRTAAYKASLWSLPNKHRSYLDFLHAYTFQRSVLDAGETQDFAFLRKSMTAMENHFVASAMKDNHPLQEAVLQLALRFYDGFDPLQRCTLAYWLGRLTYAELTGPAQAFLEEEYRRLLPKVSKNARQTLENRYDQYLFRSVSYGLMAFGRTDVLNEYLSLLLTNKVANAVDRGAVLQYLGDATQSGVDSDFYLDNDPTTGEMAIRILCSKVESALHAKRMGFAETDMMTLFTLVQARMHTSPEKLPFHLAPYCEKCLSLLEAYRNRPGNITAKKIRFYFRTVEEDLKRYLHNARFDAAFSLYTDFARIKDVKRYPWIRYGMEEVETVAEHTFNAWLMAMIFLPDEYSAQDYSKKEVMDMLLVHDLADAIMGDTPMQLSDPTRDLKQQNALLRKLFLKGTYPEVADLTHYYNVWTGYYMGQNINARIARDINLIQTANTYFDYFVKNPEKCSLEDVRAWRSEARRLSTDLGYDLFDRIVLQNPVYRKAVDKIITAKHLEAEHQGAETASKKG